MQSQFQTRRLCQIPGIPETGVSNAISDSLYIDTHSHAHTRIYVCLVAVIERSVIAEFQVVIATNCRALTNCMNGSDVSGYERESKFCFSFLWNQRIFNGYDPRINIVTRLLKTITVKPTEKQILLGNGCVTRNNRVALQSGFLFAVCSDSYGIYVQPMPRLHKVSLAVAREFICDRPQKRLSFQEAEASSQC
jgi:hypothetical protein